jgi:lipopolysaccharide transport system ATP-binding protein
MPAAIEAYQLAKKYQLYAQPSARLKEMLSPRHRSYHEEFWALEDVSFAVPRGGALGVIGPNGSGKSTLLEIAAGTVEPTRGRIVTRGRIAALLALGAGFNPEFTGRENVLMNGEILGFPRSQMERSLPQIEQFAEIGEFMDRPVKTYSTGMYLRLAFSAAIHVEPEILVVDEVLAVGDAIFVNRCVQKFQELRRRGVTVLLVSHDLPLVKLLCDRALLLYHGRVLAEGEPSDVVNRYNGLVLERQGVFLREQTARAAQDAAFEPLAYSYRHGDQQAGVASVELFDESGRPTRVLRCGETARVRVQVRFRESHPRPVVGILIRTRIGMEVYGTNTELEDAPLEAAERGESCEVNFDFTCWLTPQEYTLTVATQSPDGTSHDWLDDVLSFTVIDSRRPAGVANLQARVSSRKLPASTPLPA